METINSIHRSLISDVYFYENLSRRCYEIATDVNVNVDVFTPGFSPDDLKILVRLLRACARNCEDYEEKLLNDEGIEIADLPF